MQRLEALGRKAQEIRLRLTGESSSQFAAFERAQERMRQVGGGEIFITLGERFKSEEFEMPFLFEQHRSVNPNENRLILLWGRQKYAAGVGVEETYKGISIVASSNGKVHVEYTKSSGWVQLERQPWYLIKAFRRGQRREVPSLEERVQEALAHAEDAHWEALDMRINDGGQEEFGGFESIKVASSKT
ncbi:MAG: hypothetical protein A3F31_03410 [Candidatus Levybacteria bacterium RIFCSPHIGHO2_12_FULL_38_12]|nr:MAG: hypothetical protein A2770_03835 [Candidatus Levybacteria bacterium RIFCSPHIGHO2_01_FULL_38_12]OGH22993.1 MAG: hypothetical protein A3F31_03410 [Candidatus Levybacteria bacterium RIFCSPHIGHO2_12_FULL_38_12]OGH34165.1 MAG: hypothetical protein A3A47_03540 [Candidatus Levybacteria bacterium RIFCSPLOWO2_01_FULL_37_20]OGH44957.1 MAG: hypothetical protein A3J14_01205 [Candidatus Levybacteria bacterium RIFCSPLOWO2_02_FULL_37_18]OGH50528.1 MAG: hypothetical protein A3G13_01135 [Candidatus Levy